MEQRFDVTTVAPAGYKAMLGVHSYVQNSGLDLGLVELVRLRVSQINGCAFCLAMHVPLARQQGITDDQMHLLVAWREAPVFDAKERAALAWAEALTHLTGGDVADDVYAQVCDQFSTDEIAGLSFAVAEINAWNRLMISSRTPPQIICGAPPAPTPACPEPVRS
ncbi:carboxymuconolactone decarboxylase family protein [Telmatospirillum sp.]|uniref:carboxymuconolactone decarboxylase family protein n=1 Tax=Telmatospirillum sp. TaxID=2079197 RepID=UPI002841FEF8|nr:carboxymuconolactone decarboxylase family protein [Telmatospirillum sp.]MDR3440479.1 carboxymuconolactone decarboxylase family protein [Telmatospirillum sp.]